MGTGSREGHTSKQEGAALQCGYDTLIGVDPQARLRTEGDPLPLIFITAFPEERIRSQVQAAGALGFLVQPFAGDAMVRCIDDALRASGRARP